MKNSEVKLNPASLKAQFGVFLKKVGAYKGFLFFLAVATLYGFILWRINVYSNAPASQTEETAKATAQPRIDPDTVKKIQSLRDNSVNVQSLFDTARQNPFQE